MNLRPQKFAAMLFVASATCLTASEKVYFKENFSSYFEKAPGIVTNVKGVSVNCDSVWAAQQDLSVAGGDRAYLVYPKGIQVPSLKKVDFQFRYSFTNAKNPVAEVPAKVNAQGKVTTPAVPAKPGTPGAFEVLVNKTVIRIASDGVTLNGKTKKIPFLTAQGWGATDWGNAAIRVDDGLPYM